MVVTDQMGAVLASKRSREADANRRQERTTRMIADALGGAADSMVQGKMMKDMMAREDQIRGEERQDKDKERMLKLYMDKMRTQGKAQQDAQKEQSALQKWLASEGLDPNLSLSEAAAQIRQRNEDEKIQSSKADVAAAGLDETEFYEPSRAVDPDQPFAGLLGGPRVYSTEKAAAAVRKKTAETVREGKGSDVSANTRFIRESIERLNADQQEWRERRGRSDSIEEKRQADSDYVRKFLMFLAKDETISLEATKKKKTGELEYKDAEGIPTSYLEDVGNAAASMGNMKLAERILTVLDWREKEAKKDAK